MIYFVYDYEEKEQHELDKTTCSCMPTVRFLETGDMLIAHSSFSEPEKVHPEEVIEQAISMIMDDKL